MSTGTAKAYLIHVVGKTGGESYLLYGVSREEFMGVPCIKGTYLHPSSTTHWLASKTMYVPLENIQMVTEYESQEAYQEALKQYYKAQADRT